jgi:hypothetical protein
MFACIRKGLAGVSAAALLCGLACVAVPSAAADELLPTPAETSTVTAPTDDTAARSTPEPTDGQASETTGPETVEGSAPTDEPAEPAGEETAAPSAEEATGEPTEAANTTEAAEKTLAATAARREPRASIGDVNCNGPTVPVTLDNSLSTEAVRYGVIGTYIDEEEDSEPHFENSVRVSAGSIRIVNVPATEDTQISVVVYEDSELGSFLTSAVLRIDCIASGHPHDPQATIGRVDCASMTVDVTLDNKRSEDETVYTVRVFRFTFDGDEDTYDETFTVSAGDVLTVQRSVTEYLPVSVSVFDGNLQEEPEWDSALARESFRVDCTPGDEPGASFGDVNCTNMAVPVTLDNPRTTESSIVVMAWSDDDANLDYYFEESIRVAPGDERVMLLPVPNGSAIAVSVVNETFFWEPLAFDTIDVDCVRVLARRAGALPATGATGLMLPMTGLMLLASGGLLTLLGRRSQDTAQ